MAYIGTPAESELYAGDLEQQGYVANMTRAYAHRPELWAAWRRLVGALRGSMDWRRFATSSSSGGRSRLARSGRAGPASSARTPRA